MLFLAMMFLLASLFVAKGITGYAIIVFGVAFISSLWWLTSQIKSGVKFRAYLPKIWIIVGSFFVGFGLLGSLLIIINRLEDSIFTYLAVIFGGAILIKNGIKPESYDISYSKDNSDQHLNKLKEIKNLQKKLMPFILGFIVAALILGLGIYLIPGEDKTSLHPLLENSYVAYLLVILGIGLLIFCQIKIYPDYKKLEKLRSEK